MEIQLNIPEIIKDLVNQGIYNLYNTIDNEYYILEVPEYKGSTDSSILTHYIIDLHGNICHYFGDLKDVTNGVLKVL